MSQADPGRIITFYSYKGGTGRSMALANVGWILASNGLRVLVVDWDLEAPGLHRYFHPFLVDRGSRSTRGVIDLVWDFALAAMTQSTTGDLGWVDDHAQIMRYAESLDWDFPGDGALDIVTAGQAEPSYGLRVARLDWDVLYERQGGGELIKKLRQNMQNQYDYVLVDSRTGLSDSAGICTVDLPDVVVICFTLSRQSIDGAAAVARSISEQTKRAIRVVPVPMRVEDSEKPKLEAGRDYARARFAGFLADLDADAQQRYWGEVEVPYKSFYAYEEILATIADRPRQEHTLLASFERLTSILTNGDVRELVAAPEPERRRRLAEFEHTNAPVAADVFVSHAEPDRLWAEWIAFHLEVVGYRVIRQGHDFRPGTDLRSEIDRTLAGVAHTVVVLTPEYAESVQARATWDSALARDPTGGLGFLLPVRVTPFRPQGPFGSRVYIDLVGLDADQARDELLAGVPVSADRSPRPATARTAEADQPRYPGDEPQVFVVPLRNPHFVGRDALLLDLRARLTSGAMATVLPQALHGLGGVGKTQAAVEYAHRFAADYDLVWWVPAGQVAQARADLTRLAPLLGLTGSDDASETLRMVLDALRRGQPFRRWLLIFDDADDADEIQHLLPHGPPPHRAGHILITSRNPDWSAIAETTLVDVFTRTESIQLLRRRGGGMSDVEADRLAERLGDLPLAIEQAAAWQAETGMPIEEYLDLLEEHLAQVLSQGEPLHYPSSVGATWAIAFERLQDQSPAALQLLELCAFFGAEPIPLWMLKMGRYAPSLPAPLNQIISNSILRRRAVGEIARYALAHVDPGRDNLAVHRLVQDVLRDRMSAEERAVYRASAHELLAVATPGNPDNDRTWLAHADLSPHILPSGAVEASRPETRKVVLDQVRYRYRRGDFEGSRELAEIARRSWSRFLGPDDEQTLLVSNHLADALWWLGMLDEARDLRQETLERMSRVFGPDHELTLITAHGRGADLRVTGLFEQARTHDADSLERHRRVFGDDDPNTLRSATKLGADLRLLGDFDSARQLDEDTLERKLRTLRDGDSEVLASIASLARDLVGLGDYRGARNLLEGQLDDFRHVLGPSHNDILRASRTYALALRMAGARSESRVLAEKNLELHRLRFGDAHLDTLGAMTSAGNDRRATGDLAGAHDIGEQALDGYRRVLGPDHPFTFTAMVNLAIVQRALGDFRSARVLDEDALSGLEQTMGPTNRSTLCCRGNLTSDLAAAGNHAGARRNSEALVEQSIQVRGANHPYTLACCHNLALDLRASGEQELADALMKRTLGQMAETLGDDHPEAVAASQGTRADFPIEPPDT